jgi:hypothetical protein
MPGIIPSYPRAAASAGQQLAPIPIEWLIFCLTTRAATSAASVAASIGKHPRTIRDVPSREVRLGEASAP